MIVAEDEQDVGLLCDGWRDEKQKQQSGQNRTAHGCDFAMTGETKQIDTRTSFRPGIHEIPVCIFFSVFKVATAV